MTNIVVHEWSYINTNKEGQQRVSFIASPTVKHPDKGEWASFLGAHFYSAAAGGYLNTIGKVKCSQNRLVKGSQPGNPGEDAFTKNKVILHKVSRFFFLALFPTVSVICLSGCALRCSFGFIHCGGVSPTISMPCCWSCAWSNAFSFFSSSILNQRRKKCIIHNILHSKIQP